MESYSPFFTTIYDEQEPIGALGRGTHYSILRALFTALPSGDRQSKPMFHDFAVIWDEDHDTRVVGCLEQAYLHGLLQHFQFFGERKGEFTSILTDEFEILLDDIRLERNMEWIANNFADGDLFNSRLGSMNTPSTIISDSTQKVNLYLENIAMLWNLGTKEVRYGSSRYEDPIPHPEFPSAGY